MQAAMALFASSGTAAAAGGGGLLASAGSLSIGQILTGGFAAVSALADIAGGFAEQERFNAAAQLEEFNATQDILAGEEEALRILEEENDLAARNLVATAASGLTGEGSPAAAQEEIRSKANFEMGITRRDALIRSLSRRASAQNLRAEGSSAVGAGFGRAFGTLADTADRFSRRGQKTPQKRNPTPPQAPQ